MIHFFFLCVALSLFRCSAEDQNSTAHREMLKRIQHPDYVSSIRPYIDEEPLEVEVDIVLNSVGLIDDLKMTWTVSFYLHQEWTDPRLTVEGVDTNVRLDGKDAGMIWYPDLYFPNSKQGLQHTLTVLNSLVYINSRTGRVFTSQRLTVELHCQMDLVRFPHDNQTCSLLMESFSYSTSDLVFKWSSKENATSLEPTVYIPDFHIVNISSSHCTRKCTTGIFSCLEATVKMYREMGFYMFHTYLPSILIVSLSWASFWIDHEAVPARISVGLLTVLTITTQLTGSRAQLPRVPYIKAIDVWMAVNLVFVFAAYMEYAVVTVLSRRHRKHVARKSWELVEEGTQELSEVEVHDFEDKPTKIPTRTTTKTGQTSPQPQTSFRRPSTTGYCRPDVMRALEPTSGCHLSPCPVFPCGPGSGSVDFGRRGTDRGRIVDKRSRVLFPLAYMIFNLVYWVYYMVY